MTNSRRIKALIPSDPDFVFGLQLYPDDDREVQFSMSRSEKRDDWYFVRCECADGRINGTSRVVAFACQHVGLTGPTIDKEPLDPLPSFISEASRKLKLLPDTKEAVELMEESGWPDFGKSDEIILQSWEFREEDQPSFRLSMNFTRTRCGVDLQLWDPFLCHFHHQYHYLKHRLALIIRP